MTDQLTDRDGPRDECGVFGIFAPDHDVARLAYFALYALQHRGQESAGIATTDLGGNIMTLRDLGLVSQVFDEQKLRVAARRAGARPRALLDDRLLGVGERAARLPLRPPRGRARPQRQPHQRRRAARRAARAGRRVPLDVGLGDHRRAALDASAPNGSRTPSPTCCRACSGAFSTVVMTTEKLVAFRDPHGLRPLVLGMLGDRYCVASESCALDIIGAKLLREVEPGEVVTIDDGRDLDADGRRRRAQGLLRLRVHLLRAPRLEDGRHRAAGRARADGRDPRARGAGRSRPRDRRARLRQPRRARLRARERDPAGRRLRQEPLRRAHVHPARPGAAQARPAAEVQPDAGDRQRPAPRRRRRLDRARQHDARRSCRCCATPARWRSTCASPRRRSATPATTGSTCPRARRWSRTGARVAEIAAELGADSLHYLSLDGRLRGGRRRRARRTATPASAASTRCRARPARRTSTRSSGRCR